MHNPGNSSVCITYLCISLPDKEKQTELDNSSNVKTKQFKVIAKT